MRRAEREAAFTEFVAARQAHLRRVAYGVCGDWHTAEDLLQTAFTKLYVAWPRVVGHPEAYTRRIIVRANIDRLRRATNREVVGVDDHDRAATDGETPYEERSELFDALQALPEMQRKVVVLRHWLALSVRETADDLGLAEGTVKSHSSRGLAALKECLSASRASLD